MSVWVVGNLRYVRSLARSITRPWEVYFERDRRVVYVDPVGVESAPQRRSWREHSEPDAPKEAHGPARGLKVPQLEIF